MATKCNILQLAILSIQIILCCCVFWVFEDLPELEQNITTIYNDLDIYNYSVLLETAVLYYDELKELTYGVNTIDYHDPEADIMLRRIYDDGGPIHAYDPPYKQISKLYKWTEKEKLGYEDLMNKTIKVWDLLKLKVKDLEDLEPESSGNF